MKYSDAGVDIDAGDAFIRLIKPAVRKTFGPHVLSDLGSFGGVIRIVETGPDALLVASIDGVGTKLLLAAETGMLDDVGRDLVHHCVNDIAVHGARPLFFLDYIGAGRLEPERAAVLVTGMAAACAEQGMALLGGETAEMPGLYQPGHYDLVGAIVGTVQRPDFIDGSAVRPGDALIGIASNGLHTNGYSLARRALFEAGGLQPGDRPDGLDGTLAEVLLRPHLCYAPALRKLAGEGLLHGAAHITGGGIPGNLARILPGGTDAVIDRGGWSVPEIFRIIAAHGGVATEEMYRTFNMGAGLIAAVPEDGKEAALALLAEAGHDGFHAGRITEGEGRVRFEPGDNQTNG